MQRIPVVIEAEFRGVRPPSEWTDRKTGEQRTAPARLKFEVQVGSGDVEPLELSQDAYERCGPAIAAADLLRGDMVVIRGSVVVQDGYFAPAVVERA